MIRRWVLTGFAMISFLAGCASDVREIAVNHTLQLMDQTTTRVKTLKEKVNAATEKLAAATDKDRELDLSESIKVCDELKKFCKEQVQKNALDIQSMRLAVSDAEKEDLKKRFEGTINAKMLAMIKEGGELDGAIKKLETTSNSVTFANNTKREDARKAIEDFKKKVGEAQAEFESLNRKS